MGAWRILDAQYFGVPQRRRRVFVVARRADAAGPDPSEILFEPEGVRGSSSASLAKRARTAPGLEGGIGVSVAGTLQSHHPRNAPDDAQCGVGGVYQCHGGNVGPLDALRRGNGGVTGGVPFVAGAYPIQDVDRVGARGQNGLGIGADGDPSYALQASSVHGVACVVHETGQGWWKQSDQAGTLRVGGERPSSPSHIVVVATRESGGHPNSNAPGRHQEDDFNLVVANTVQASAGHHGRSSPRGDGSDNLIVAPSTEAPFVIYPESGQGADLAASPCEVAPALRTVGGTGGTDRGLRLAGTLGVRRLMPVECERLQGFPVGWTDIPGSSDARRYQAIGNAVAVPVIEWVGWRFLELVDGSV